MHEFFCVGLGGAIGSMIRFWLSGIVPRFGWTTPFWGTMLVNVTGSFLIGFIAATTGPEGRYPTSQTVRNFLTAGICGGYTTFSSFSLQTLSLIQMGDWGAAGLNVAGSVLLCYFAVWLGYTAGGALHRVF